MNKKRRAAIESIIEKVNSIYSDVSDIKDLIAEIKSEQEEAVDNVPESFQETERFERMQKALEEAENEIDYALEHLSRTEYDLNEAVDA